MIFGLKSIMYAAIFKISEYTISLGPLYYILALYQIVLVGKSWPVGENETIIRQ